MGDLGAMVSGAAVGVIAAVLLIELRCWRLRRATGALAERLTALRSEVERSELRYGTRMRGLEQRFAGVERAVARAEDGAHVSAATITCLRRDLAPRIELLEEATRAAEAVDAAEAAAAAETAGVSPGGGGGQPGSS